MTRQLERPKGSRPDAGRRTKPVMLGRIKLKSLANFTRNLGMSLRSGVTLTRALPIIARESRDPRLRRTVQELIVEINGGHTLTEALRRRENRFPPIFVETVAAGERTGHLDQVFARLADYFDTRLRLRRAVIRASVYPIIQLSMAFAVLTLILVIFSSNKMAMARTVGFSSTTVTIVIVLVVFFFSRVSIGRAIWDHALLSVPFLRSLVIKLCMARFTKTLAMQLESGISVPDAVESAALVSGNSVIARNLVGMANPLRGGSGLAESLSGSKYVTPMIQEVLAVGEETGNFSESLERIADIYEEESLMVLESMPRFIAPLVAIIVGILVVYLFYKVYFVHYIGPLLEMVGM